MLDLPTNSHFIGKPKIQLGIGGNFPSIFRAYLDSLAASGCGNLHGFWGLGQKLTLGSGGQILCHKLGKWIDQPSVPRTRRRLKVQLISFDQRSLGRFRNHVMSSEVFEVYKILGHRFQFYISSYYIHFTIFIWAVFKIPVGRWLCGIILPTILRIVTIQ